MEIKELKEMLAEAEKNLKEYVEENFFTEYGKEFKLIFNSSCGMEAFRFFPMYRALLLRVFNLGDLLKEEIKQKKEIDNNEK
jgi:hypothetical protein